MFASPDSLRAHVRKGASVARPLVANPRRLIWDVVTFALV